MDPAIEVAVRVRARSRCEYCRFPEGFAELPFHCDHIIARQHGGLTTLDNLALLESARQRVQRIESA